MSDRTAIIHKQTYDSVWYYPPDWCLILSVWPPDIIWTTLNEIRSYLDPLPLNFGPARTWFWFPVTPPPSRPKYRGEPHEHPRLWNGLHLGTWTWLKGWIMPPISAANLGEQEERFNRRHRRTRRLLCFAFFDEIQDRNCATSSTRPSSTPNSSSPQSWTMKILRQSDCVIEDGTFAFSH